MEAAGLGSGVVEGFAGRWRADTHVVILHVRMQDAFGSRRPLVQVGLDPVGVALQEGCHLVVVVGAGDACGADKGGDDGGERGGRVASTLSSQRSC